MDSQTDTDWGTAVKHDGLALQRVPSALLTEAMCFEAVRQHYAALCFVPPRFMTLPVLTQAIERSNGAAVYCVPSWVLHQEPFLCLYALTYDSTLDIPPGIVVSLEPYLFE